MTSKRNFYSTVLTLGISVISLIILVVSLLRVEYSQKNEEILGKAISSGAKISTLLDDLPDSFYRSSLNKKLRELSWSINLTFIYVEFEGKTSYFPIDSIKFVDIDKIDKLESGKVFDLSGNPIIKFKFKYGYYLIDLKPFKVNYVILSIISTLLIILVICSYVLIRGWLKEDLLHSCLHFVLDVDHKHVFIVDPKYNILFFNKEASFLVGPLLDSSGSKSHNFISLFKPDSFLQVRKALESSDLNNKEFILNNGLETKVVIESECTDFGYLLKVSECSKVEEGRELHIQAQKFQIIGKLASGIAHDFNNLLGAIQGNLMIARRYIESELRDNFITHNLEEIQNLSLTAKDTMNKLLSFSRCQRTVRRPIDFKTLLVESFQISKALLTKVPSLEIKWCDAFNNKRYFVEVDSTQVHLILQNLLLNAYHALRDSSNEEKRIDVFLDVVEENGSLVALFSVTDSGVGIAEADMDYLFMPYFSTKKSSGGTGLGLSTVKEIVEDHDGRIEVASELGVGTTFKVYLPIVEKVSVNSPLKRVSRFENVEKVMIVDDEYIVARPLSILLKTLFNIDSEIFLDPRDALKAYDELPEMYDVVISDMVMPVMGGLEFYKGVKSIKKDCPFLIITGYAENKDVAWLLDNGASGLLSKPFSEKDLKEFFGEE